MSKTSTLSLIVAMDSDGAIGQAGDMPWGRSMKGDLRHFKETTIGHPILMGRTTYESFPRRPLPGRLNIVLTRRSDYTVEEGAVVAHSVEEALRLAEGADEIFVIGGRQIYEQLIDRADRLYVTLVHHTFPGADTHFPDIDPAEWQLTREEPHPADPSNAFPYTFTTLERRKS